MPLKQELIKQIKAMYPHYAYLHKYKKAELQDLLGVECSKENTYFKWHNNSCYLDSMLFVMSLMPHHIFEINPNLIERQAKYARIMKKELEANVFKTFCIKRLRKILERFDGSIDIDWLEEQQEPMDLWRTIEEMFIPQNTKYIVQQYGVKGTQKTLVNQNTQNFPTSIQEVTLPIEKLSLKEKYTSKHTPTSLFKGTYTKRMEVRKIVKTDVLIFNIARQSDYDHTKLFDPVHMPMRLKPTENAKPLYLKAVIVHHGQQGTGGHYTTVYECGGYWYEYDDMKATIKKLGKKIPTYYEKNSAVVFYWN